MSLPTPKEVLKKLAEVHDSIAETLTKPVRDLAATLGLPEPPELPKAADIVESLPEPPELPTPEALLPATATTVKKHDEVTKLEVVEKKGVERFGELRMKIL